MAAGVAWPAWIRVRACAWPTSRATWRSNSRSTRCSPNCGASASRPLPGPLRVVDRGSHGWVEWVEQAEVRAPGACTRLLPGGRLACVPDLRPWRRRPPRREPGGGAGGPLWSMRRCSCSRPRAGRFRSRTASPQASAVTDGESCLSPGLPSLLTVGRDGRIYDVGGLQPSPERQTAVAARRWVSLRSDAVHYVETRQVQPALKNDAAAGRRGAAAGGPCRCDLRRLRGGVSLLPLEPRRRVRRAMGRCAGSRAARRACSFRPSDQYGALLYRWPRRATSAAASTGAWRSRRCLRVSRRRGRSGPPAGR